MKCSVVIRSFNEQKYLRLLLEGILKQTEKDVEIILVDSGSTDDTLKIASEYPVKIIHILSSEFTFGKALNLGIQAAKGDFIVIASAHVYPTDEFWIEKLIAPFQNPQVALSYGRQIGNEITKFSEHQVFKKWFPENVSAIQEHPFCNNANAAIRKSLWLQLQYDEKLTGLEDLDWAKRALVLKHKIAYVSDAVIVHIHEETPQRILNRYRREAIAYKRIFPEASFSFWDFIFLFISNLLSDYYYAAKQGLFWQEISEIFTFRIMQFWGTYQGYQQKGEVSQVLKRRFYYPNIYKNK
jgi:glycosyltransferase involved in cell wall biosynthesis